MKKKIWGLILAMCIMLGCATVTVNAAESGICGENLTWTFDNGTLTISGEGDMKDWGSTLRAPWYILCSGIKDIVIENGVTSIGEYSFWGYNELVNVSIPPSIERIGKSAFTSESIENFYISDLAAWCGMDFEDWWNNPLSKAKNLYVNSELTTNLVIPDGTTKIGNNAFGHCECITDVSIPQSVTEIGEEAFLWCDNLARVSISSGVKSIGKSAFSFCDKLEAIEVDENNESYMSEDGVLFDKAQTSLIHYSPQKSDTSYTIPDSVKRIEYGAFSGSKNLETIDIPDSVNYIGEFAFETCSNLTSLTIPDSVTVIRQGLVEDCEKLSSIKFPDSLTRIDMYVIDGTAYYKDPSNWIEGVLYVDNCLIDARRNIVSGEYQIREGTVMIADVAFYNCENLTGVRIPESVNGIGDCAFRHSGIYNDESNWVDNALYIDNCLVDTKKDLLSGDYQIKDGTRLIADYVFSRADGITSITVPESVTKIGDETFYIYNGNIDLKFMAPIAAKLTGEEFWDNIRKIYIHEDYTGYTSENGYDESKIIVEPHSYEAGVCSVCGKTKQKIERTDNDLDTEYSFTVNLEQAYEDCDVYAAVYDENGALLEVKKEPLKASEGTVVSVKKSEKDKYVKVFVWTGEMQPIEVRKFM